MSADTIVDVAAAEMERQSSQKAEIAELKRLIGPYDHLPVVVVTPGIYGRLQATGEFDMSRFEIRGKVIPR